MGSTVTTGRTATAFRALSGEVIYCLYEQTYEKNCHPHTPHWSATYIGAARGALQKVFGYAAMCEGGMLQNRAGRITPEGYLRSWLAELQSPQTMTRDHSVTLYVNDSSIYAPLSTSMLPAVTTTLAEFGMQLAADRIAHGEKIDLSLFLDADLIARLHSEHQASAWSLLPEYTRPRSTDARDPSLGLPSTKVPVDVPDHPPALVVSEHGDMIMRDERGIWRCRGWPYEIMGAYIQSLAAIEETHPGNYRRLIQSYREHLKAARKAEPGELVVHFDTRLVTSKSDGQRIKEAASIPGSKWLGDVLLIPFSAEHAYTLTHLPREATTWRVASDAARMATAFASAHAA